MASVIIRDMDPADEYYVATCTHVGESDEIDACAERRLAWLESMHSEGLRVKVALCDDAPVGFLYVMPIEICPWGPRGRDLSVIPCLVASRKVKGRGAGRALIHAAEEEARSQGSKALVTTAYYGDFWFMPARFFERCGFSKVRSREVTTEGEKGYLEEETILWKVWDSSAEFPEFLERKYEFEPVSGKVVVDLFWNTFCQTSNIEAHRVREVAAEFGGKVILHEYNADDREIISRYGLPRGIFVNGREIGWGYEAPRDGIREAISRALRTKA
jgi:GNAT superfamily N-acetyltransferase/thiol-disulfide isomerase/thioredoxin